MDKVTKKIIIAVIAAAVVIAGVVFFANRANGPSDGENGGRISIRPVQANEHILGDVSAPIVIVEYSDLECQFCKAFHETMKRLREEYGENLAWVYRHFPLVQIHENALPLAEASECVAELGGNEAFWNFIDGIFKSAPGDERFDIALLPDITESVGVKAEPLSTCLDDNRHIASVKADSDEAIKAGGRGTPYSLIFVGGKIIHIEGAWSFETLKALIDEGLTENVP